MMAHRSRARELAQRVVEKLKNCIPRQMFLITIKGLSGKHTLAREDLRPYRKDVTAKCVSVFYDILAKGHCYNLHFGIELLLITKLVLKPPQLTRLTSDIQLGFTMGKLLPFGRIHCICVCYMCSWTILSFFF